jgi:hypothetical protein
LPGNDYWLDMAGATALTGIAPKTISSWLARGGPARNPFPVPQRFLYRLYWSGADITSWQISEATAGRRYLPEAKRLAGDVRIGLRQGGGEDKAGPPPGAR